MKKALVKKAVAVGIFVVALLIIDALMNKKNADIAAEMKPATLPVVSVWLGEYKVNTMYGYATKQKEAYTKDSLTPVAEDRNMSLVIDTFQNKVDSIAYEVRSADGERLIEGSEITDYQKQGGEIRFSLQLY